MQQEEIDLENKKLDLEVQRLKLERQKTFLELSLKRSEQKAQQNQQKSKWSQVFSPAGTAILAGLLGLFGTVLNNYFSIQTEAQKRQGDLIVEAIKTGGNTKDRQKQTAANLVFFVDAGLIKVPDTFLVKLRKIAGETLPSLPATSEYKNIDEMSTTALSSELMRRDSTIKKIDVTGRVSVSQKYDILSQAVKSKNYVFNEQDGSVNIIGYRQVDNIDKYDDVIYLVWRDKQIKYVKEFRASCDPGRWATLHPINVDGTANMMDGQYEYVTGFFMEREGLQVLRSNSKQSIWRDKNKNFIYDKEDVVTEGYFGLMIMPGSIKKDVGDSGVAAGSQLIYGDREGVEWKEFIDVILKASKTQKIFYYSLFTVPKRQ